MGFYVANEQKAVAGEPRLSPQAKPEIPLKKSRLEFFSSSSSRAGLFASQPLETHWETEPTPAKTASGMSFFLSRDPIGEIGFWADKDVFAMLSLTKRISMLRQFLYMKGQYEVLSDTEVLIAMELLQKNYRSTFVYQEFERYLKEAHLSKEGFYLFVGNNPMGAIDFLGLITCYGKCDIVQSYYRVACFNAGLCDCAERAEDFHDDCDSCCSDLTFPASLFWDSYCRSYFDGSAYP